MKKSVWVIRLDRRGRIVEIRRLTADTAPLLPLLRRVGTAPEALCGEKGTCGRCRVRLVGESAGDFFRDWVDGLAVGSTLTLPKRDVVREVLACQTDLTESTAVIVEDSLSRPDVSRPATGSDSLDGGENGKGQAAEDGAARRTPDKATASNRSTCAESNSERFGVAVDLGTTTLASSLIDLDSGAVLGRTIDGNPQTAYGADVISRIAFVENNAEGPAELGRLLHAPLSNQIDRLAANAGIDRRKIEKVVAAGNSVMEYLFLGLDPSPIGQFPFRPPVVSFDSVLSRSLGWDIAPDGNVTVLPILTGFIGGDLTAGIFALEATRAGTSAPFDFGRNGPELLIDIGTNGEILLFHDEKIFAASTAAGPVFEGGGIQSGMRAEPGAITSFRIEPNPFESGGNESPQNAVDRTLDDAACFCYETVENGPAVGICGSGLVDIVAEFLRAGLIRTNGKLVRTTEIAPGRGVILTQGDIRRVQLAVGAIRAGLTLLMETADVSSDKIKRVNLAGGFGCGLCLENARRIGLLPPSIPLDRFHYCGNTSLIGAEAILKDPRLLSRADSLRRQTVHLELAADPRFVSVFTQSMIFPQNE